MSSVMAANILAFTGEIDGLSDVSAASMQCLPASWLLAGPASLTAVVLGGRVVFFLGVGGGRAIAGAHSARQLFVAREACRPPLVDRGVERNEQVGCELRPCVPTCCVFFV